MFYTCTKFQENISKGFRVIEMLCGLYTVISKGDDSVKGLGWVMVLLLSTSSDSVLYLYQVLSKYLIGLRT